MSMDEALIVAMCKVVVIGKVQSLVGQTVMITDGSTQYTGVFGSDLVVTFDVWSTKKYTVTAGAFSEVVIVGSGQYVEVELGAFDRLWIYNRGKQDFDLTGGFYRSIDGANANRSYAELATYDNSIIGSNAAGLYTGKQVDVTGYKTLWVQINPIPAVTYCAMVVGLATGQTMSTAVWKKYVNSFWSSFDKETWVPLDISELSGLHYVFGFASNGNGSTPSGYIVIRRLFLSKDTVTPLIARSTSLLNPAPFIGGTVTADSVFSGWQISGAIRRQDNNYDTNTYSGTDMWSSLATGTDRWYKVIFDTAKVANIVRVDMAYSIAANNVELLGSNDDINYTSLTTLVFASSVHSNIKLFNNTVAYKYYKLKFTNMRSGNQVGLTGVQLYSCNNLTKVYKDLN